MRRSTAPAEALDSDPTWWRGATVYQVYVRSFADASGDGVGDLDGIRSRLGYLELLGVDALWLTPFYTSPMADHGYDVADPRDVDPVFGDLAAFDALVAEAHALGIRVIVDVVPNHTSTRHDWFRAAILAGQDSPPRDRYVFRDGRGPNGAEPPNNWPSVFGGPAWTRVPDGQWYLHLFAPEQPDLNWRNPDVWEDFERTLRFWIDRGVDGFRIDVAHGMVKPEDLADLDHVPDTVIGGFRGPDPRFDHDDVHEVHRLIRKVLDEHPGVVAIGELWVQDDERFARYVRSDELHLGFNFRLAVAECDAAQVRDAIEHSTAAVAAVGAPPTWTLSNHDVPRQVTRYGGGAAGLRRARAMALVELALPGTVFLYNGEELGLADVELPHWAMQDPMWERTGHEMGRDGCRVPLPWEGQAAPYGFSPTATPTWLPMPDDWAQVTVEAQLEDPDSTLSLYRTAIELRRTHPMLRTAPDDTTDGAAGGSPEPHEPVEVEWYGAPAGCCAFRRSDTGLVCALNTSGDPVPLPPGDLLLSSAPLVDGALPPDAAAWIVPPPA